MEERRARKARWLQKKREAKRRAHEAAKRASALVAGKRFGRPVRQRFTGVPRGGHAWAKKQAKMRAQKAAWRAKQAAKRARWGRGVKKIGGGMQRARLPRGFTAHIAAEKAKKAAQVAAQALKKKQFRLKRAIKRTGQEAAF